MPIQKKIRYIYAVVIFVSTISLVGCHVSSTGETKSEKVFLVNDFGAVADGKTDCGDAVRAAVAAAIKAGTGSKVVFGPGIYRISPESQARLETAPEVDQDYDPQKEEYELYKKCALMDLPACVDVNNADGISFIGQEGQTELVVTRPLADLIRFENCSNVLVKNLTVDYDPLPFTQGTILAIDTENATFDLKLDAGYPSLSEYWFEIADAKWGMCFDEDGTFRQGGPSAAFIDSWERIEGETWRMKLHIESQVKLLKEGDRFVQIARTGGKAAFRFWYCDNVLVDNATVYTNSSTAFLFYRCSGDLTIRNTKVIRRPETTRLLSGCADAIHCQSAVKGPLVENCVFEGLADDAMNFYGIPAEVREVIADNKVRIHRTDLIKAGDRLQIIEPIDGIRKADGIIAVKVENDLITFDRAVEGLKAGKNFLEADTIYNLSACGSDFIIRNNIIGGFRGRGILMRAPNGLIENNTIQYTSGQGIAIGNEPTWPEGPMPSKITIRNNTLIGVSRDSDGWKGEAIQLISCGKNWRIPTKGRGVRDIVIEGNTIIDPPGHVLVASSIKGLVIENNTVKLSKDAREYDSYKGIRLVNCEDVVIKNLTITDPLNRFEYAVKIDADCAPGDEGVKIESVTADLASDGKLIIDER